MRQQVQLVSILHIVYGSLGFLAALILHLILESHSDQTDSLSTYGVLQIVAKLFVLFLFIVAIPEIVGGIAILKRRVWGKTVLLIVGVFQLLNVPFGTILGIYTFWVLQKDETTRFLTEDHKS